MRLQTLRRRVARPLNECLRRTVQIAMPGYGYTSTIGISFGILTLMIEPMDASASFARLSDSRRSPVATAFQLPATVRFAFSFR